MTFLWLIPLALAAAAVTACTKPNPAFCCLTPEDCAAAGVTDELRPCAVGQACIDFSCTAASCSTDGCAATAPVCEVTTDVCVGCTDSSECARFPDSDVCDTTTGSCVECVMDIECEADRPVCDAGSCRTCKLDSECPSRACADDGTCVDEAAIVYIAPNGVDAGTCPRSAPCKGLQFTLSQTDATRNHMVLAAGTYVNVGSPALSIHAGSTTASKIAIHGGGAILTETMADGQPMLDFSLPTTMRDLELVYGQFGPAISIQATSVVERVKIRGNGVVVDGIVVRGPATVREISIEGTSTGIEVASGVLTLDRAILKGGTNGIKAASGTTVDISNVLIFGTSKEGIDLTSGSTVGGSISFVTIADTGTSSTAAAGLTCPRDSFPVDSTIIWTPASSRPPANVCGFVSAIAGPIGIVGATDIDPGFVNPAMGDYHLSPNSPARDMVDTGPTSDFEGSPRPNGPRFDIGADEITP